MKRKIHLEPVKGHHKKQHCVKYHPSDPQEARPRLASVWLALGTYNCIKAGERSGVPIGTAYKTLKVAALEVRARYPHLGIQILEDGREMFPDAGQKSIH